MQLHVIGLGVAEQAVLDDIALKALTTSNRVIGSTRQLDTVRHWLAEHQHVTVLPKLSELKVQLHEWLQKDKETVTLLASGDPLFYGIGKWVQNNFSNVLTDEQRRFHPAVSSIQVACHRLGWSLQDVEVVSLHGRPLKNLISHLRPNQRYALLTDQHSTAQAIAGVCQEAGFTSATFTVCERLGYADEQVRHFSQQELLEGQAQSLMFNTLNVVCVQTVDIETAIDTEKEHFEKQKDKQKIAPVFPGIADQQFVTDKANGKGMLTKREVRLAILALLEPSSIDCIWDIGAGCGGVAVELSLWGRGAQVYAVEHHSQRLACLSENRLRFQVENHLHIIEGDAPQACDTLPRANKVFIGGSGGQLPDILKQAWEQLPIGGVMVASAVTEATKQQLYQFYQTKFDNNSYGFEKEGFGNDGFETVEISISRGETLAGELYYKPNLPVTLYKFKKYKFTKVQVYKKSGEP